MAINRNNKIQILYSQTASQKPDVTQLEPGELAINTADGIIYFNKNGSTGSIDSNQMIGATVDNNDIVGPDESGYFSILGGTDISVSTDDSNVMVIDYIGSGSSTYTWNLSQVTSGSFGNNDIPNSGNATFAYRTFGNSWSMYIHKTDLDSQDASSYLVDGLYDFMNTAYQNATSVRIFIVNHTTSNSWSFVGIPSEPFNDTFNNNVQIGFSNQGGEDFVDFFSLNDDISISWEVNSGIVGTNNKYGLTAGTTPSSGEFGVTRVVGTPITSSTELHIHKTDLFGYDNRTKNLSLNDLLDLNATIVAYPYDGPKGFTSGQTIFRTNGTGSYNGTYYTLGLDSVDVESNTDGITLGSKVNFVVYNTYRVAGSDTTGYVESFNGQTGGVQGVSSFNGATGVIEGVSTVNGETGDVTAGGAGIRFTFEESLPSIGAGEISISSAVLAISDTSASGLGMTGALQDFNDAGGGSILVSDSSGDSVLYVSNIPASSITDEAGYWRFILGDYDLINDEANMVQGEDLYLTLMPNPSYTGITSSNFLFGEEANSFNVTNRYPISFGNGGFSTSADATSGIVIPYDCTATAMYISSENAPTSAVDLELYVNGIGTGVTMGGSGLTASNTSFSVSISAGDVVNFYLNAGVGGSDHRVSLKLDQWCPLA